MYVMSCHVMSCHVMSCHVCVCTYVHMYACICISTYAYARIYMYTLHCICKCYIERYYCRLSHCRSVFVQNQTNLKTCVDEAFVLKRDNIDFECALPRGGKLWGRPGCS